MRASVRWVFEIMGSHRSSALWPARTWGRRLLAEPARLPVGGIGRLGLILTIWATVVGAGYAASELDLTPISDPTRRLELPGLSVLPPKGDDWFLASVPQYKDSSAVQLVVFVKKVRDEPVTRPADARLMYARVNVWDLQHPGYEAPTAFQSSAHFVKWVKEGFATRQKGDMVSRRQRLLGAEATADDSFGATCVRYSRSTELIGWAHFTESTFILITRGLYCLHPHWPGYIIDVGYTQQHLEGEEPLPLEAEVEPFLTSPVFNTIRPMAERSDYAKCVEDTSDSDLYIDYCTRAIKSANLSNEHLASILYNRGWRYGRMGEYDRAVADFDRAVELKPDFAEALHDRGLAYERMGEYDRAVADYGEAIRVKPDYAQAFFDRGFVYHHTGQDDRAIADYDEAIRLKSDYADAFRERGHVYYRKGEHDRAIVDYEQAIRLDPDDADAYNNLAWLLATTRNAHLRDGRKAVTFATKAVQLNDTAASHDTLAAAYAEAQRFEDAVAEQERAIEMLHAAGKYDEVPDLRNRLDLYRRGRPYRE